MSRYKVTERYSYEDVGIKKVEDCWIPHGSRTDTVLPKVKVPTISAFPVSSSPILPPASSSPILPPAPSSPILPPASSSPILPPASPVSVYVRVRPPEEEGQGVMPGLVVETSEPANTVATAFQQDTSTIGGFTGILGPEANNELVFQRCFKSLLGTVVEGGTASLFCYGCTGAGKSHTVIGDGGERGLYERAAEDLMDRLEDNYEGDGLFLVITAIEICGDDVFDLMGEEKKLVEGSNRTKSDDGHNTEIVMTRGLRSVLVKTKDDMDAMKTKALQFRVVGSSSEQTKSRKSHAILKMEIMNQEMLEAREAAEEARSVIPALLSAIENHAKVCFYTLCDSRSGNQSIALKQLDGGQKEWDTLRAELEVRRDLLEKTVGQDSAVVAKIEAAYESLREVPVPEAVGGAVVLVDLAGADDDKSDLCTAQEKKESADINKSLLELRECFISISLTHGADDKPNFRGSKLTKLLQDSLLPGPQSERRNRCSETVLVVNVSPAEHAAKKTLNVLKYGQILADESSKKAEEKVPRGQTTEDKTDKVKLVKKRAAPARKEYRWKS